MVKIVIGILLLIAVLNLRQTITGAVGAVLVAFTIIASFFIYTMVYHGDAIVVPDSYQQKQDKIQDMYKEDIKYEEME